MDRSDVGFTKWAFGSGQTAVGLQRNPSQSAGQRWQYCNDDS